MSYPAYSLFSPSPEAAPASRTSLWLIASPYFVIKTSCHCAQLCVLVLSLATRSVHIYTDWVSGGNTRMPVDPWWTATTGTGATATPSTNVTDNALSALLQSTYREIPPSPVSLISFTSLLPLELCRSVVEFSSPVREPHTHIYIYIRSPSSLSLSRGHAS